MEAEKVQAMQKSREQAKYDSCISRMNGYFGLRERYLNLAKRERLMWVADEWRESANKCVEGAIKVSLENLGEFTNQRFNLALSMKSINMIRNYYENGEPSTSFRITHPLMAKGLGKAYSVYIKAAKEVLDKETNEVKKKKLIANLVEVERLEKKFLLFSPKRS